ncbi:hypothetical protein [Enhygromyxa salina]|uniref:Uncharacterized protein n=1 Tax=Enhygromyxa salina TaxID=215803 RepID=A0A2S9Y668_9BACT|nr:hypothetical protein [Enhygromyxa salina]PRQ00597.1 hypothetical protein ENSA7_60920 [Enhygromyxa salina]
MALLVGAEAQAFEWTSSEMPWPPELRPALQPPPRAGHEDPNPETLSALLHDRLDELEPTRVGVGVATRDLAFWLWGFKRDTAALEPEHAACLAALRHALDRLPAGSFNVAVYAATSTRFTERWSGSGVEALADARVDAVRAALGLHPAKPGMHTMVEGFAQRVPVSSAEDPREVARRRVVHCALYGELFSERRHELDTVTAETLDFGPLHAALRTSDMGDLFTDERMGGATVRALLRRNRRYLACLLAPQWVRPYPSWAHRVSRLLREHYVRRDDADKGRIRQLERTAAIFGVRCEVLALLRGLFGDRGGLHARLGRHRTELDVSSIACFELLEVEGGAASHRLRTLARRLRDIELDSDLGPAVVVAAAEAIAQRSLGGCYEKEVPPGWEEFCVAVARPQLSDLVIQ